MTVQGGVGGSIQGSSMFDTRYMYETNKVIRSFFYPEFMFGSLEKVPWIQRMLKLSLLLVNDYYLQLLFASGLSMCVVIQSNLGNITDREMLFFLGCLGKSRRLYISFILFLKWTGLNILETDGNTSQKTLTLFTVVVRNQLVIVHSTFVVCLSIIFVIFVEP